jgi:hypothetical protein
MQCRHCGDEPPSDCPADVTSCHGYANWQARQLGDMLSADEADMLTVWAGLCAMYVATRDGLELLPNSRRGDLHRFRRFRRFSVAERRISLQLHLTQLCNDFRLFRCLSLQHHHYLSDQLGLSRSTSKMEEVVH